MRTRTGLLLIVLMTFGCGQDDATPMRVSVCDLAKRPWSFNGCVVEITAELRSDGIEHSVAFDSRCPDSGVTLERDEDAAQEDLATLSAALKSGR